ncbi:hypothetical protein IFM89_021229 [Coptis chinensis]|uniref:Pentatricopeptide repeat-containing protein n=1 Tax=Coptis chinensis TaxID=261450 RepID=A0A835LMA1_9MAGN|nr:hypothetical protein IFM89_021229 [Coptis chinensis]
MLRSLSRNSIRSITNTLVSVFSRAYSDSQCTTKSVTSCLQSQIVSALQVGDRDRAFKFLTAFTSSSNQILKPDDFIHILNYCATSPDTVFFMETWRIMEEKEIEMDTRCYSSIIQALTKGGYLEEALNWLSFLGSSPHSAPDLSMYNIFLNGCAQMGSMVHANSCLDLMENRLVGKSESTYLALLKLAVLQESLSAVQEIWKQYTKYYCPNIRSLQEFIRSFARLGDLVTALKALQHAVVLVFQGNASIERPVKGSFQSSRLDIPIPSTIDFAFKGSSMEENSLSLHPSPVLGAMTRAVEGDFREHDVELFSNIDKALYDFVKYPNRISVASGTGCRSSALFTVTNKEQNLSRELAHGSSDILNNGIDAMHAMKILRLSFNDVIQACAQARKCKLAEQLFLEMQKLGLEPDSHTFNGLIRAVVNKRGVREGLKLLKAMEEMNLKPCNATLRMLSIGCSKVLELDLAEALLDQAVESPCIQPFNCLLAACDVVDQPERAVRLLSKMKQLKLKSNMETYELLFSLFGNVNAPYKKGDIFSRVDVAKRISAIEMDMLKNGLQHSHSSMVNLLKALGAEGMIKELIHYLSVAKTQFFLANTMEGTIIYNSVLYSLFEADEVGDSLCSLSSL